MNEISTFISFAWGVFSSFVLPLVSLIAFGVSVWLLVGFLYLNLGFEVQPTPYGDLMREIYSGRAGVHLERPSAAGAIK